MYSQNATISFNALKEVDIHDEAYPTVPHGGFVTNDIPGDVDPLVNLNSDTEEDTAEEPAKDKDVAEDGRNVEFLDNITEPAPSAAEK